MKRIELVHYETHELEVHYEGPNGNDYTLCGDTLDECVGEPTETKKRVTCERCKAIVRHVRGASY